MTAVDAVTCRDCGRHFDPAAVWGRDALNAPTCPTGGDHRADLTLLPPLIGPTEYREIRFRYTDDEPAAGTLDHRLWRIENQLAYLCERYPAEALPDFFGTWNGLRLTQAEVLLGAYFDASDAAADAYGTGNEDVMNRAVDRLGDAVYSIDQAVRGVAS